MNIEIANRLMELRKKSGLSQEELANKLGISRQSVSKWERAEASPDTDNLIALAKIYNVSLDEILRSDETIEDIARNAKQRTEAKEVKIEKDDKTIIINEDGSSTTFTVNDIKRKKIHHIFQGSAFTLIVIFAYLLIGFSGKSWGIPTWHPTWIILLLIPIYYSAVEAIYKRDANKLAIPVVCVFIYLGYCLYAPYFNLPVLWHPGWVIFFIIPLYYSIFKEKDEKKSKVTIKDSVNVHSDNGDEVTINLKDGIKVHGENGQNVNINLKDGIKVYNDNGEAVNIKGVKVHVHDEHDKTNVNLKNGIHVHVDEKDGKKVNIDIPFNVKDDKKD